MTRKVDMITQPRPCPEVELPVGGCPPAFRKRPDRHRAVQEGAKRPSLALPWHLHTNQVQHCGHDVDVLGEPLHQPVHNTRISEHWRPNNHRDVERLVVEAQLRHQAVVAQHLAMVGGNDYQRVVDRPQVVQGSK